MMSPEVEPMLNAFLTPSDHLNQYSPTKVNRRAALLMFASPSPAMIGFTATPLTTSLYWLVRPQQLQPVVAVHPPLAPQSRLPWR